MRFAWMPVLVLGLVVANAAGCSGCVEDKSAPDKPAADKGPLGAKQQRQARPIIITEPDAGSAGNGTAPDGAR